ncbi:hypothetical protein AB1Y20_018859 [Prymnesium parvum]|uniref:Uncharacterized protein n=1 Tax=Prymnesium parvum TaxID=97485 RepID=A0AB34JSU8_PRYPA
MLSAVEGRLIPHTEERGACEALALSSNEPTTPRALTVAGPTAACAQCSASACNSRGSASAHGSTVDSSSASSAFPRATSDGRTLSWLSANRAKRCVLKLLRPLRAGEGGTLLLTLKPGIRKELEYTAFALGHELHSVIPELTLRATEAESGSLHEVWRETTTFPIVDDIGGVNDFPVPIRALTAASRHWISATLDGRPVGGGLLEVLVRPVATAITACTLHTWDKGGRYPRNAPSLSAPHGEGGESFYVMVRPVDRSVGLAAAMHALNDVEATARLEVSDLGDGRYSVRFVRAVAGLYECRAWLHGEPLLSALSCRVVPGALSLARCTASGDGLRRAEAGVSTEVWVEARDRCGNLVGVGGEAWRVWFEPHPAEAAFTAEAAAEASAAVSIRDCEDGRYCVSYCVRRAARYALHIAQEGKRGVAELPAGPWPLVVRASAFDPSCLQSSMELGEPVLMSAGQVGEILLSVRPSAVSGIAEARHVLKHVTAHFGGEAGAATDALSAQARVVHVSLSDDVCRVRFAAFVCVDAALLHIKLGGVDLDGSPATLRVAPATTYAPNCLLRARAPSAEEWARFSACVQPLLIESATVGAVRETRHSVVPVGEPSAMLRHVAEGGVAAEVWGAAEGEFQVRAGDESELWLFAMDRYCNRRRVGEDAFVVSLTLRSPRGEVKAGEGVAVQEEGPHVLDQADGSYKVRFVRAVAGLYECRAWLHGEPLLSALSCRVVPGALSLARCTASGDGLRRAEAGVPTELWVEARDWCGNLVDVGGEAWRVWLEPIRAEETLQSSAASFEMEESYATAAMADTAALEANEALSVRDYGDGRYCVSYCVRRAARYKLHVLHASGIADLALPGSPFPLLVTPSPADPFSTVVVDGWKECVAGVPNIVQLKPSDFGDEALLQLYVNRIEASVRLRHRPDVVLAYVPAHIVNTRPKVRVEGVPLAGSPFEFRVLPGIPSARGSTLHLLSRSHESPASQNLPEPTKHAHLSNDGSSQLSAGLRGRLLLRVCDAFGNPTGRSAGGEAVQIALCPPDVVEEDEEQLLYVCQVHDQGDGTYVGTFLILEAGVYLARAWVHGEPLLSTLACRVVPGAFSLARCTASGDGLRRAEAGVSTEVWVEARDWCGNVVGVGGEAWRVWFEPHPAEAAFTAEAAAEASAAVSIRDCEDGRYCVSYCVRRAARYALHIAPEGSCSANSELPGSPFFLVVAPSSVEPSRCTAVGDWVSGSAVAGELCVGWVQPADTGGNPLPPTALLDMIAKVVDGPARRQRALALAAEDSVLLHNAALEAVWRLRPELDISPELARSAACVCFRAEAAGDLELHLTVQGMHINGSPFSLRVDPAAACAARTQVLEAPETILQGFIETGPCHVVLRTHDRFGNSRDKGGDNVRLILKG